MKDTLGLSEKSNLYLPTERTQIKFCFTVNGSNYARLLANTIINAQFESINNFDIYACDDESRSVLDSFGLKYHSCYERNYYVAKARNILISSKNNPNTLIIGIDIVCNFNYKDVRGIFGRLKYKNNRIYTFSDKYISPSNSKGLSAFCILAYNVSSKTIAKYDKTYSKLFCANYKKLKSSQYPTYRQKYLELFGTYVVEEDILMCMRTIKDNKRLLYRVLRGFYGYNSGRNIITEILESKYKNGLYSGYFYNKDLFGELNK